MNGVATQLSNILGKRVSKGGMGSSQFINSIASECATYCTSITEIFFILFRAT